MNLNSIISYKKRGKINKNIISNLKNDNKSTNYSYNKIYKKQEQSNQIYNPNDIEHNRKNIKCSFQSIQNDQQDEEIISILKSKFSNDIEQKLNKLVINNKFKTENLNMNININYNPSKSTKKNSLKQEKELSMYLKKNKINASKSSHLYPNTYHFHDSQQKHSNTNKKVINFNGTCGLQTSFSPINEEPQNSLISESKKKSRMKHEHSHEKEKLQTYKQIYGTHENCSKTKILKSKKSRSFNLNRHNHNANHLQQNFHQSKFQNHQNFHNHQQKESKRNFRYKSLEPKQKKYRYESIDHSNFINTKSSTIQMRIPVNNCDIIKGKTQQLIKNKNSQETLKQNSFRRDGSKVTRVLTQQSKQLRRKLYNSIKKCQTIDTSQEKLRLMKSQSLNHEQKQKQQTYSPIMCYLKNILRRKMKQKIAFKSIQIINKSKLNCVDENELKEISNRRQISSQIQFHNRLINLLKRKEKSEEIIEVAYELFCILENENSFVFQRKFTAAVCIFYTFKEMIESIFCLQTLKEQIYQNYSQIELKIRILDRNSSSKNVILWSLDCNQFYEVYNYIHDQNIEEVKRCYLLKDLLDLLMKQISTSYDQFKNLHSIITNTSKNDFIFNKKTKIYQIILENCVQIIRYFEKYQQRHKDQEEQEITQQIIQSFIIELKLIQLFICRNSIIVKKSSLSIQNWDRFHSNEQYSKVYQKFLCKYESFQRQLKKRTQKKNATTDQKTYFQSLRSKQQSQNILILAAFNLKDLYLPDLEFKTSTHSLQQHYADLHASLQSGQHILFKAYTIYLKQQYNQCQMFIQQKINQCEKPFLIKLLCLDLMVRIKIKSFYDAQTLIQRLAYFDIRLNEKDKNSWKQQIKLKDNIKQKQRKQEVCIQQNYLYELKCYERFISGVMLLIKRRPQQGLQRLNQANHLLHSSPTINSPPHHNDPIPPFSLFISTIIQSYLGYAYYCTRNLDSALKSFEKQMMIFMENRIQNNKQSQQQQSEVNVVRYNRLLCKGLMQLKSQNYRQCIQLLKQSLKILNRPQPHCYLTIAYLRLIELTTITSTTINVINNNNTTDNILQNEFTQHHQTSTYQQQMYTHLNIACRLTSTMNNNFAAEIFYLRSIYSCSRNNWHFALIDIEQTIDKSQQNQPKHFFLRAMIFACGENYTQAINQTTTVISLDEKFHQAYLLRSKCAQLSGDQNQAFHDLQSYILLRPDDRQIHKYAGYLLFQSGSFQDAILAFQQGMENNYYSSCDQKNHVEQTNFHVYLTKSKTYFLMGEFEQAAQQMKIASKIKNNIPEYHFDLLMMQFISQLTKIFQNNHYQQCQQQSSLSYSLTQSKQNLSNILTKKLTQLDTIYHSTQSSHGKIFKLLQHHLFRHTILFYLHNYIQSITQANICINLKSLNYQIQTENNLYQQFQQEQNQKELFINQMRYNIALAYIKMKEYQRAEDELLKCDVSRTTKSYLEWKHLLCHVTGVGETVCKGLQCDDNSQINVYSDKNKLSKYFPYVSFTFTPNDSKKKTTVQKRMKPCIPFPKVEPPQITPTFDPSLLSSFTQDCIDKKPQAPWITNQKNCIKFTQQIKTFSKLDIQDSQNESKMKNRLSVKNRNENENKNQSQMQYLNINDEIFKQNQLIKKRSSRLSINMKLNNHDYYRQRQNNNNIPLNNSQTKNLRELLKLNSDVESKLKRLIN